MLKRNVIVLVILAVILILTSVILINTASDDAVDTTGIEDNIVDGAGIKPAMAELKIATTVPIIKEFIGVVIGNDENIVILNKNNIDVNMLNDLDLIVYIDDEGYDSWFNSIIQEIEIDKQVRVLRLADSIEGYTDYGWMSIGNAMRMLNDIALVVSELDLDYSDVYNDNIQPYIHKLDSIKNEYYTLISSGELREIILANEEEEAKIKCLLDEFNISYSLVDDNEEQIDKVITFKNIEDYSDNMTYIDILKVNRNILEELID